MRREVLTGRNANERLIAAAPELLEALELLFRSVQNEMEIRRLPLEWAAETPIGKAEAAIRNAKGEAEQ